MMCLICETEREITYSTAGDVESGVPPMKSICAFCIREKYPDTRPVDDDDGQPETVPPNHYKCTQCGFVFQKFRPDDEALGEMEAYFGPVVEEERMIVCQSCFDEIMGWARKMETRAVAEAEAMLRDAAKEGSE